MALSAAEFPPNHSFIGPYLSGSSLLAPARLVATPTTLTMMKSTGDPTNGANWASEGTDITLAAAILAIWSQVQGGKIHVATVEVGGRIAYHRYDPGTDDWDVSNDEVDSGASGADDWAAGVVLAVRSDGDIVVAYQELNVNHEVTMAVSAAGGGAWGGYQTVRDIASEEWLATSIAVMASDRIHIFLTGPATVGHRALSSADVLQTYQAIDATTGDVVFITCNAIAYGTTVKVAYVDASGSLSGLRATSADVPTWSTDADFTANDVLVNVAEGVVASYALDDTDTWAVYASAIDADLYRLVQADAGSWSGEAEQEDAVSAAHVSAAVYDRSGLKLGYLYDDAGTLVLGEYSLAAAPTGTPVRGIIFI